MARLIILVLSTLLLQVLVTGIMSFFLRSSVLLPGRGGRNWQQRSYSLSKALQGSVSGNVYSSDNSSDPVVLLFTKEGCTLCDKVKDVLTSVRSLHPHSLEQIDITDKDHNDWFDRYKYDIPVLHMNGNYWIKHRLTAEEAMKGIDEGKKGEFRSPEGEPNAAEMERK